jgi:hypothetical protein
VNTRQVAAGTVLSASLLLGGASLADASPSRPAMDRGVVDCDRLENRLERVQDHLGRLEDRQARLEQRLAVAQADGDHRRERRLRIQLNQVARAEAKLTAVAAGLEERYADRCAPYVIPE